MYDKILTFSSSRVFFKDKKVPSTLNLLAAVKRHLPGAEKGKPKGRVTASVVRQRSALVKPRLKKPRTICLHIYQHVINESSRGHPKILEASKGIRF